MEPIPETLEAINELDPSVDDVDLLDQLTSRADAARAIAPACVGISVASLDMGVTFTLVATSEEIAALDAMQYLTDGPCERAVKVNQGIATNIGDLLAEATWQSFSQAAAASGIRSTLTFPIMEGEHAIGSVNFYGGSEDAFSGKHPELAHIFRAWAPGAVTNADLSFSTRSLAQQAPGLLREETKVSVATGILAASEGTDVEKAKQRLEDAARRAGITLTRLAEIIISLRQR